MTMETSAQDSQTTSTAPPPPLQTALLVDESGYLSSHSLAVLGFLGYTPAQAPKRVNLLSHFAQWDRQRAGVALGQSLTTGKQHQSIYTLIRADGRCFPVRLTCAPCHCSGRPSGLKISLDCL
ncbi:MAG: hypothetical protein KQI62_09300 [Deltaproteobacteria bacterium]|nr:hypothetical protein [Deltaproteobacteria bacterium]